MLKGGYTAANSSLSHEEAARIAAASDMSGTDGAVPCQLCFKDLKHVSVEQRQTHYEEHFSEAPQGPTSAGAEYSSPAAEPTRASSSNPGKRRARKDFPPKENMFWYPTRNEPPPSNFTPGLIPVLRRSLNSSHAKGNTLKAALCYDRAVHIATQLWDLGWGCGYRNFLMACTALMDQQIQPMYPTLLDGPPAPGVRNLQDLIEEAWANGFDEEGAGQLKRHLSGTRKWIGTGELCVAFNYRGVPAQLVDFDLTQNGTQTVIDWVLEYFSGPAKKRGNLEDALRGASPIMSTDRMPLVLQHAGHSRTIIGYEQTKNGVNLLLFDPSKKPNAELRQAAMAAASQPFASPSKLSLKAHSTASRLLHKIAHPLHHQKRKQNENDPGVAGAGPHKRPRSSEPQSTQDGEDVIIIDDAPAPGNASVQSAIALQPAKVINFFRLNAKQLGRKDKYQILYFPLTEPLSEEQQRAAHVLTSEKVQ